MILDNNQWMKWAEKLQSIAQAGLAYSTDKYDIERFEEIRNLSVEILKNYSDLEIHKIKEIFAGETGYQTPKVDVRAVVFKEDKILLVREKAIKKWCMPGGWADTGLSIKENLIKESKEEAGIDVEPVRIIALMDRNRHNYPRIPLSIYKVFVECKYLSGEFIDNIETEAADYFSLNNLPELAGRKTTKEQIELCFKARNNENFIPYFD